ncbi:hypothetical protein B4Q13_21195, partial [Lacticaseibacillus rhamnosus]
MPTSTRLPELVPSPIIRGAPSAAAVGGLREECPVLDDAPEVRRLDGDGDIWLVRRVSEKTADFGVIAIDLGSVPSGTVDEIRTSDHDIQAGMETDPREHGGDRDGFPGIYRDLGMPADTARIVVPAWLGGEHCQTAE